MFATLRAARTRDAVFAEANWHDYAQFTRSVRTDRWLLVRNYYRDVPLWNSVDSIDAPTWDGFLELRKAAKLDVLAGVDYAIAQGVADPNRLGIGGWSYGGMLTNYTIVKTTRFKGAISGASVGNVSALYGHDHYQRHYEAELDLPWRNREAWDRVSPFWQVEKITTPTMWICGEKDWNVPVINSEQMYQAMKRLGRETQLVVYPGEFHGIRRPSYQKDRLERYLAWYDKYVKGSSTTTAP